MKTVRIKIYKFNELPEDAKQKAIEKLWEINVTYDWWDCIYKDAKIVGIRITSSDNRDCKGEFIEDAVYTAHRIIDNHGENCQTYKTAISFLQERDELVDTWPMDKNNDFINECELDNSLDILESNFLKSILEDYRIMLVKDYEYLTSKQAIIDTIEANDYDFTVDGRIYK